MAAFMVGKGREPLNLLESQIRYAMEHTKSNREAATFLKVSYPTYKKYAKLYVDSETGKTLFDSHKNQSGKGIKKNFKHVSTKYPLTEILEGKYPDYPIHNLKSRLIRNLVFEEKCSSCGFDERRSTDFQIPLLLDHCNGNRKDHTKDNLRILCYNCYFLEGKNPFGREKKNIEEL